MAIKKDPQMLVMIRDGRAYLLKRDKARLEVLLRGVIERKLSPEEEQELRWLVEEYG